jgi:hypothetical protein
MDADLTYHLYRAFHLGARAMLNLQGNQITNSQCKQLQALLRQLAAEEITLHDPGADAMKQPMIGEFIAQSGAPIAIKNDKELAAEILEYWK